MYLLQTLIGSLPCLRLLRLARIITWFLFHDTQLQRALYQTSTKESVSSPDFIKQEESSKHQAYRSGFERNSRCFKSSLRRDLNVYGKLRIKKNSVSYDLNTPIRERFFLCLFYELLMSLRIVCILCTPMKNILIPGHEYVALSLKSAVLPGFSQICYIVKETPHQRY